MATTSTWTLNQAALRRVTHGSTGDVVKYMTRKSHQAAAIARRLAPVDTGRMRSTIHVDGPVNATNGVAFYLVANTIYARYVHDGTRYMRARPFLMDAIRRVV